MINFTAQRPLNTLNERIPKNSLKTFTKVEIEKLRFENGLQKVVYMDNVDKLAII